MVLLFYADTGTYDIANDGMTFAGRDLGASRPESAPTGKG
jgi:hypothetical protein